MLKIREVWKATKIPVMGSNLLYAKFRKYRWVFGVIEVIFDRFGHILR